MEHCLKPRYFSKEEQKIISQSLYSAVVLVGWARPGNLQTAAPQQHRGEKGPRVGESGDGGGPSLRVPAESGGRVSRSAWKGKRYGFCTQRWRARLEMDPMCVKIKSIPVDM